MLGIKRQNVGSSEDIPSEKRPRSASTEQQSTSEKMKVLCDRFCWRCHKEGTLLECRVCPRSFHPRCDPQGPSPDSQWTCFECRRIMAAEDVDTRSPAMALLSVEQLRTLLKYAVLRLKQNALIVFHNPVPIEEYPKYPDYIVHPMDLSLLEKNIRDLVYGSTEAFLADVKWILHNSIIFNGDGHKLTSAAKSVTNAAKQEMKEIEICPDCYLHAHTLKEKWFIEPCRRSHVLVWAKMKGYPYWPGKALRVVGGNIDVRFFGAHDRAQVPPQLCFMLSYDMPQPLKSKKKAKFNVALEELELHIQKLRAKLGGFEYASTRTPLDPERLYLQPISKVTTGRRHSDAEQATQPKGRTVTIVTSSWMRKMQAEGLNKSPIKEKKEKPKLNASNFENSNVTNRFNPPPVGRMQGPQRPPPTNKPVTVKTEPKSRISGDRSNLPAGVFEISDRSLNIPTELDINSASVNLHVAELPYMEKHREFQNTLDKIQKRIRETFQDDSHDDESSCETTETVPEKSASNSISNPDSNKLDPEPKTIEPIGNVNDDCDKTDSHVELSVDSNCADELDHSSTSPPPLDPSTVDQEEWVKDKKSCAFSQRLGQTIESCKAKLGIQEFDDEPSAEKSSESEDDGSDEDEEHAHSECGQTSDINSTRLPSDTEPTDNPSKPTDALVDIEPPTLTEETALSMETDSHVESSGKLDDTAAAVLVEEKLANSNDSEQTLEDNVTAEVAVCDDRPEESQVASSSGDELVIDVHEQDSNQDQMEDRPQFLANGINQIDSSNSRSASPKESAVAEDFPTLKRTTPDPIEANISSQMDSNPDSEMANYAHKLIDFMKELGRDGGNNPQATIRSLELELETQRWHHQQELVEIKHNTDLVLLEVRASLEIEKERALSELKRKHFMEKQKCIDEMRKKFSDEKTKMEKQKELEIEEIKKKQWCANCQKEAIYYCCWNTSYCDYPCQQAHWVTHQESCNQLQGNSLLEMPHHKRNLSINKPVISSTQLPRSSPNIIQVTPIVTPKVNSTPLALPQQQQQSVQVQYMPSSACYQLMAPNVTLSPSTLPRMPQKGWPRPTSFH